MSDDYPPEYNAWGTYEKHLCEVLEKIAATLKGMQKDLADIKKLLDSQPTI